MKYLCIILIMYIYYLTVLYYIIYYKLPPGVLSPFRGGGGLPTSMTRIAMLAGVYTLVRATQARQVEGERSDKVAAQLLFLFTLLFFSPLLSCY